MRLPLKGLICVFIAAGCSTNKPPETVDSTSSSTTDIPDTTEPLASADPVPAPSEDSSAASTPDAEPTTEYSGATATAPATIGEPATASAAPMEPKPDNTKVNKRDTDSAALTPLDQGENESDLKVTQQIRQAVMADDSLSFTAKNVKIITMKGKVTLRGPVKTAAERSSIEGAARKVAGANMVDNQLEVAP